MTNNIKSGTGVSLAVLLSFAVHGDLLSARAITKRETVAVIASGLNNPRGLDFGPDGALYVAEAGMGGQGPCAEGPEGFRCYGSSGSVTRIDLRSGSAVRVASGLPSAASGDGSFATGPHDVSFLGLGQGLVTIGYAGHPSNRTTDFGPAGTQFARLVRLTANGAWALEEDLGNYEAAANPTGDEADTNPYGVLALPGRRIVVDAGANALNQIDARGTLSTLATFPNRLVEAPPFLGLPPGALIEMDAVPTSVAIGPDGCFYVGQLTGFPFPAAGANIFRVHPQGGPPEIVATGFAAVIDLAFGPDGSLYVLELAKNGLLDAFIGNDWAGALVRIGPDGDRGELARGTLTAPGGLAIARDGTVFVTNHSILSGTGEVLRIAP